MLALMHLILTFKRGTGTSGFHGYADAEHLR
jgi:hypothetical protein